MTLPLLGVVVVTFNSMDVILDCLESLLVSERVRLAVVVVDNASTDATPELLRNWASGRVAYDPPSDLPFRLAPRGGPVNLREGDADASVPSDGHTLTLIEAGANSGFAAGVNRGLAYLADLPEIGRFWILNPDGVAAPGAAAAFATADPGPTGFSVMGGRVIYLDGANETIQIDGGLIDRRTGVTKNANQFRRHPVTPPADPDRLDFITGASMVISREFHERAGPMPEDYFLYYEEVDWALRRADLPLAYCAEGIVYHRGGTAIGSPVMGRSASPFSLYFKHRGRLRFVRRHLPRSLPGAHAYSLAKAGQLLLKGHFAEARALLAGGFGLQPPRAVRDRLSPEAQRLAFED